MSDYAAKDFENVVATDDGYTAKVKGVQKTLSRTDPDDSIEIGILDAMLISA